MQESDPSNSFALVLTAVITSSLSLVSSIVILTTFLTSRRIRENAFFFWVFHLAIVDFFLSMGSLFNWFKATDIQCTLFSVFTGYGIMGSYTIVTCIALFLLKTIKREINESIIYTKKHKIITGIYIIITILCIGPIFTSSYGVGTVFCWLKTDINVASLFWTTIEYYIPIAISIPMITYLYYKTYREVTSDKFHPKSIRVLLLIPLLYIITNYFAVADRILSYPEDSSLFVKIGHILMRQLQGFYHCIIYGYSYVKSNFMHESLISDKRRKLRRENGKEEDSSESVISF